MELRPCEDAVQWLHARWFRDLQEAWDQCSRGDWMLWLADETCGDVNSESHRRLAAAKAACARLVLPFFEQRYPHDLRPRVAIEAAERYASGKDCDAAGAAAAAAYALTAADAAPSSDARAAAYAAAAAAATDVPARVAAPALRGDMLKRCADEIRKVMPQCPVK